MPVQYTICLADSQANTARTQIAFHTLADTVKGKMDISAVIKHAGERRIQGKHFYTADLDHPMTMPTEKVLG